MKTIYNADLGKTVWRGTDYLVMGKPGTVEPPCHLLDVVTVEPPTDFDPPTHTLDAIPHRMLGAEWRNDFTIRPLTADELAAQAHRDLTAMAYSAAAAAFETLSPGKQALWEPVRAKVAAYIMAGDFATASATLQSMPVVYEEAEQDRDMFLSLFAQLQP